MPWLFNNNASCFSQVWVDASDGEAVFIREFTLSRHDDLPDDFLSESPARDKSEDSVSVSICLMVVFS